jgi:phage terminase large subunit-like protein
MSSAELEFHQYDWQFWRRAKQRPPAPPWTYWLIKAGRGFGKTRVGAETVRQWVKRFSRVNLIGATADDARDIMVEGESGILAICPRDERPTYRKGERKLLWPNGATSLIFTADEPERLRGKQHEKLWPDELAAWRYAEEAWDQAMMGLRLGTEPQAVITTTPRPTKIIKRLMADPACIVTNGSTYENRPNLAPSFFAEIIKRYEGTRLGRQELLAEILEDNPGALWTRAMIEASRVTAAPALDRIVVALDPAAGSGEENAETGIVVAGVSGTDYFVLDDRSLRDHPQRWAAAGVGAYHHWRADRIVGEANHGGEMIEALLRAVDADVSYHSVRATRGKLIRAEPIAALYEQGRVHHVGCFPPLEDQMCEWVPGDESPDRMDALVWALTELSEGQLFAPVGALGQTRRRD